MQVSEVSNEDGIQLACVIRALNTARFDNVSLKDMDAVASAKRWLFDVAQKVAGKLPTAVKREIAVPSPPSTTTAGMKIKAAGPIGGHVPRKKKK